MAEFPESLVDAVVSIVPWTYDSMHEMGRDAAVAILRAIADEGYLLIAESGGVDPVNPQLIADELETLDV